MPIPLVLAGVIAAVGGGGVGVGVWIGRRLERSLNPQPSNCGAIFYGNPQSQPDRLPIPKANTDYPDGRKPDIPTSDLGHGVRARPTCDDDRGSLLPPIVPGEQAAPGGLLRFFGGSAGWRQAG